MSELFTVILKSPYNEDEKGLSFSGELIPATPEEIKAAHGRCLTCKHRINYHCNNPDSFAYQQVFPQPSMTYCNHHEPKEE